MEEVKQSKIHELNYELEQYKAKVSELSLGIKDLEKDKQNKQNQLVNSEIMLNELQQRILQENETIKKLELLEKDVPITKEVQHKFIEDRNIQEIDKKITEKLKELAAKRLPLIPTKLKSVKEYKKDETNLMMVHSIKILYLKGLKDGELEKFDRSNALEMSVRLRGKTSFKEIKELACTFWELDENIYTIRAYNFALIEYIEESVENFIRDQKMRPEFWLLHNDINAFRSLTPENDYFTEGSTKNQFGAFDKNRNKEVNHEGRIENYEKFLGTFEGMKTFMPPKSIIDENAESNRLESWELNIFTFCCISSLVLLTLIIHFFMGDFKTRYWISNQFISALINQTAA